MSLFNQQYWDSICEKCGLCCYEKHNRFIKTSHKKEPSVSSRYYVDMDEPCPYLDQQTNLCTVYERRFEVCRECGKLSFFRAVFAGYLPENCAYVKKFSIFSRK